MRRTLAHPDQLPLELDADSLEREIERRVAVRCQAEAVRWKFQLVAIETLMMGTLVAVAGLALNQPALMVARAALMVAASCLATGMLMLGLSAWTARLIVRVKRWRAS